MITPGADEDELERAKLELLAHLREDPRFDVEAFVAGRPEHERAELRRFARDVCWLRAALLDEALESGRVVGGYRLERELGAGAAAVVWEATELALKRPVALKLLRPHQLLTSDLARRRFESEARAGARLVHPNIVRTYAHGESEGRLFIAQELVPGGKSLADWIAAERGSSEPRNRERDLARLFCDIARAVAHAHGAGVIHRDLKPGNILLGPDGVPHVADFGLARWKEESGLTGSGEHAPGTPCYMSPEQVAPEGGAVGEASDVFSLGATLYEALTLERAFDGDSPSIVMERIRLVDPPEPRRVRPSVSRDLSAICMEALQKDPRQRYASVEDLAADLERFLAGQPLRAKAFGRWARLRRRALRQRGRLVVLALVLVGALGAVVALRSRIQARRVEDFLVELLKSVKKSSSKHTARPLIEAAERLERGEGLEVQSKPTLEIGIGLYHASELDHALPLLRAALEARTKAFGVNSVAHAEAALALARVYMGKGMADPAEPLFRDALRIYRHELDPMDPLVPRCMIEVAWGLRSLGHWEEALNLCHEALELLEARSTTYPGEKASACSLEANLLLDRGDYDGAFRKECEALENLDSTDTTTGRRLNELRHASVAAYRSGDLRSAEELAQRANELARDAFGQTDPESLECAAWLAGLHWDRGRYEEAEQEYRRIITGLPHDETLQGLFAQNSLGVCLRDQGRYPEALECLEGVASESSRLSDEFRGGLWINLAKTHLELGNLGEARALAESSLALREQQLPERPCDLAECRTLLATLDAREGCPEEAIRALLCAKDQLEIACYQLGAREIERLADIEEALGQVHRQVGDPAQALTWLERCAERRAERYGPAHPKSVRIENELRALVDGSER